MSTIFIIENGVPGEYGYHVLTMFNDRDAAFEKISEVVETSWLSGAYIREFTPGHECSYQAWKVNLDHGCSCGRTYSTPQAYETILVEEQKWRDGLPKRAAEQAFNQKYTDLGDSINARERDEVNSLMKDGVSESDARDKASEKFKNERTSWREGYLSGL